MNKAIVKIKNRLGNISIYGGPMDSDKAEQTAEYLRTRKEYRTCTIYTEQVTKRRKQK